MPQGFLAFPSLCTGVYHRSAAYNILGTVILRFSFLMLWYNMPLISLASHWNWSIQWVPLVAAYFMCSLNCSSQLSVTPSDLWDTVGAIDIPDKLRGHPCSNFIFPLFFRSLTHFLVKSISCILSSSNCKLCSLDQSFAPPSLVIILVSLAVSA